MTHYPSLPRLRFCRRFGYNRLSSRNVFRSLYAMKILLLCSLALCLPLVGMAQQGQPKARKLLPYAYTINDFPNGLRLPTVPPDYPTLVALYIVVQAGSRNEVEEGKTGFAHFFEHMMFRGSQN